MISLFSPFLYLTLGVLFSSLTLIPHISISKQRPVYFHLSIHISLSLSCALPLCGRGDKNSAMFTLPLFVEAAVFRGDLDGIWTTWTYVHVCFDGIGEWRQQHCERKESKKRNTLLMWNHNPYCNYYTKHFQKCVNECTFSPKVLTILMPYCVNIEIHFLLLLHSWFWSYSLAFGLRSLTEHSIHSTSL